MIQTDWLDLNKLENIQQPLNFSDNKPNPVSMINKATQWRLIVSSAALCAPPETSMPRPLHSLNVAWHVIFGHVGIRAHSANALILNDGVAMEMSVGLMKEDWCVTMAEVLFD